MNDIIIFDVETTGLVREGIADPGQQPCITEAALMRVERVSGRELARYTTLIKPSCAIPPETVKINGIDDAMVKGAPSFALVFDRLASEFRLADELVAHNLRFDLMMLVYELMRLDKLYRFPFPTHHVDTVPLVPAEVGSRKLEKWSAHVLGDKWTPQSHRAMGDVERLHRCWLTVRT